MMLTVEQFALQSGGYFTKPDDCRCLLNDRDVNGMAGGTPLRQVTTTGCQS